MDMQDKEFDALFHSKLNDFEITPSPKVWGTIDGELKTSSRKGLLYPLLSIAASILVLVCAGLLLIPKGVKTNGKPQAKYNLAVVKPAADNIAQAKINTNPIVVRAKPVTKQQLTQLTVIKPVLSPAVKKELPVTEHISPKRVSEQITMAAVTKPEQITATVPDKTTPIAIEQAEEPAVFITKPTVAAMQLPVNVNTETTPAKARHRIHTLGDLINLAVAKVDKRQDKFIEFTNSDDDDESNITAVNFGILKIKKEK